MFKNYAARGITVCDRWLSFENFLADMGHPEEGMTIERIDNSGSYEPGNCKWASRKEQLRNTRRTVMVEYQGRRMCMMDWSIELGISYREILRLKADGLGFDEIFGALQRRKAARNEQQVQV